MSASQLIYFDLDDTLLDHAGAEECAQRETFEAHSAVFSGLAFDEWIPRYREANKALWTAYAKGEVDGSLVRTERFSRALASFGLEVEASGPLSRAYLACYAKHWRLNDGAEEILAAASERGIVGILSNGFREIQQAKSARSSTPPPRDPRTGIDCARSMWAIRSRRMSSARRPRVGSRSSSTRRERCRRLRSCT